jgi:hypothetical protein
MKSILSTALLASVLMVSSQVAMAAPAGAVTAVGGGVGTVLTTEMVLGGLFVIVVVDSLGSTGTK